jgi:Ca-activated chloride channel homolog
MNVSWTVPNNNGDYIGISRSGDDSSLQYTYISSGTPAPGNYTLNYFIGLDNSVLASVPIAVVEVHATHTALSEGRAGAMIDVSWTGPNNTGDYIGISKLGEDSSLQYTYTSCGTPAKMRLTTQPGQYELKYYVGQDNSVLASIPIRINRATASLSVPPKGFVGAVLDVQWTGPNNDADYIGICKPGSIDILDCSSTSSGSPINISLPTEPGLYEIKYFVGQDNSVLASVSIVVKAKQ